MKTWLITGCSSGLGAALAAAVLENGDRLVATARDRAAVAGLEDSHPDSALALALDVTNDEQIANALDDAEERFGAVDVLVNNAGYGYRSAVEEGAEANVRKLFETNFFGPAAMIRAVLPGMRARRSGTIVNVSSIAARDFPPGSGYYAATKAALEAITASLRKEVGPLGIAAMAVEPGAFRTDFMGRSLDQSSTAIGDYADTSGRRRQENQTVDGTQRGDPAKAAVAIVAAASDPEPPFMLVLGPDAQERFAAAQLSLGADLEAWRELGAGTDFSD